MGKGSVIGLDMAKHAFQVHEADASGRIAIRKQLRRAQVLQVLGRQPRCVVAMEVCSSAHHSGREIARLGHTVRLIPPPYDKMP